MFSFGLILFIGVATQTGEAREIPQFDKLKTRRALGVIDDDLCKLKEQTIEAYSERLAEVHHAFNMYMGPNNGKSLNKALRGNLNVLQYSKIFSTTDNYRKHSVLEYLDEIAKNNCHSDVKEVKEEFENNYLNAEPKRFKILQKLFNNYHC